MYDKTVQDLKRAVVTEKAYIVSLNNQIAELRALAQEETVQRDELKGFSHLMRKQIGTLNTKHNNNTDALERGLSLMNEQIDSMLTQGYISVKQMERNSKNLAARSASQFFMSKYTASKVFSSQYSGVGSPPSNKKAAKSKSLKGSVVEK